jgi:flagellar assembly factor FliW
MIVETTRLGQLDIAESQIIRFEQGLPGFENLKQFALIDLEEGLPYKWLQSVEEAEVALLLADPFLFYPEYEWRLPDSVQEELKLSESAQVEVWSVITLASELKDSSINLLAPILLNRAERIAKQHILHDNQYQSRHPLIRTEFTDAESAEEES